jgi:hypothetical protein
MITYQHAMLCMDAQEIMLQTYWSGSYVCTAPQPEKLTH